jgi:hypothetical protein
MRDVQVQAGLSYSSASWLSASPRTGNCGSGEPAFCRGRAESSPVARDVRRTQLKAVGDDMSARQDHVGEYVEDAILYLGLRIVVVSTLFGLFIVLSKV